MKNKYIKLMFLSALIGVLPGCVSLPPLVVIQHKDKPGDQAVAQRLDSIDRRLSQIEQENNTK